MQNIPLELFLTILGGTLSIIGILCLWILNKINSNLEKAIVRIAKHDEKLAVIEIKLDSKVNKEECFRHHAARV